MLDESQLKKVCERMLDLYLKGSELGMDLKILTIKKAIIKRDFFIAFGSDATTPLKRFLGKCKDEMGKPGVVEQFFNVNFGYMSILLESLLREVEIDWKVKCATKETEQLKVPPNILILDDQVLELNFHRTWGISRSDNRPYAEIIVHGNTGIYKRLFCLIDTGADYTMLPEALATELGYDLSKGKIQSIVTSTGNRGVVRQIDNVKVRLCGKEFKTKCLFSPQNLALLGRTTLLQCMDFGLNPRGWFGFKF